jgi:hypothetical protein
MTECYRQKHTVTLRVVFLTVCFRIVLSVLGEKESKTNRFWQKHGVTRCVWAKMQSKTVCFWQYTACSEKKSNLRFWRIPRMKLSAFDENT